MPTISPGLAGFTDLILLSVFTSLPPMIRSYSRPSSVRTLYSASRMARALSPLVKSTKGSFLKDVVGVMMACSSSAVGIGSSAGPRDGPQPLILHRNIETRPRRIRYPRVLHLCAFHRWARVHIGGSILSAHPVSGCARSNCRVDVFPTSTLQPRHRRRREFS